jgi:hypothetical protein
MAAGGAAGPAPIVTVEMAADGTRAHPPPQAHGPEPRPGSKAKVEPASAWPDLPRMPAAGSLRSTDSDDPRADSEARSRWSLRQPEVAAGPRKKGWRP